jgi:hypothetical protein
MFCCEHPYDLACYGSCECLNLGIDAEQDGIYTFEYTYGIPATTHKQELRNVIAGQVLYLPFAVNEHSTILLKIKQPDGTYYNVSGYDCFSLKTNPTLNHGFSEYGSGCNLPAEDLNTQEQFNDTSLLYQVLSESNDTHRTIQINPVIHSGNPTSRYLVNIANSWITVGKDGRFSVYLPAGTYSIRVEPLSDFGLFQPFTVSLTLI